MKTAIRRCTVLCAILFLPLTAHANGEIHYVGFNQFVAVSGADPGGVFDDYIRKLRPIMARYGMTVESYDVQHGGSDDLAADVVTFGTATDQESFQEFFQDPEFQQIFPMLVGALSDHHVIFVSDPISVTDKKDAHALLTLGWVDGEAATGLARLAALNDEISRVFDAYGVELATQTVGVSSSQGLASDVTPTTPPHVLELWSMRDAHGFFDDPIVQDSHEAAKKILSRSESFWLKRRDIR